MVSTVKTNSKFTIHPFRALHKKTLLPLSIGDYVARFSLELIILAIASFTVFANFSLAHASHNDQTQDQSIIFSFLKDNPKLNNPLVSESGTTTIVAHSDQWIAQAAAQSPSVVLTASQAGAPDSLGSTIQNDVIVKTNPADTQDLRSGTTTYEVQTGDTLESVAESFGLSPATLMVENNLNASSAIKPGQNLIILPIDGISYTLKQNDTLESIAAKYNIDLDYLLEVNNLETSEDAQPGISIVIPTKVAVPQAPSKPASSGSGKYALTQATAPVDLSAGDLSFIWPTTTHNITQGFSSRHTGIDISDSHEDPIYAAESGFVEISGYQTNGYGNTIVINHGNGFKTRYGHASELYVKAGDYVTKGQIIAKQGNTGHVVGVTGIHLHFEIIKNGVRVNPLLYVQP